jgi:hypothetical protein
MSISRRKGSMVDVSAVRASYILNVVDIAFNPDIGMNPRNDLRVRKTRNINIRWNLVIGLTHMNHG